MRRRAIVYINDEEIITLLNLPEGFSVVGINADFPRMAIAVCVESDTLIETPAGVILPELTFEGERYIPRYKTWKDGYLQGHAQGLLDGKHSG